MAAVPGRPSENYLNPQAENRILPGKFTMTIKKGDIFRHVLAGAGGWGDPLERDPAAVLKDVRNELLSAAKAADDYGVIVDTARWTVDAAATAKRREEIRARARLGGRAQGAMARSAHARSGRGTGRRMSERYRVGVDIGGTFTDIVLLGADGTLHTKKISSSVGNYAQAIVEGLSELFAETGLAGGVIEEIRHGTTVASNAILEHKGARVGLITTKGFRDVLEIRTLRMPRLYDLAWEKPAPLVERYLRQVVDERVDARGRIERALDARDAERAVDALLAEKVEAIAVCLLNSFTNPRHELMIKEILERKAPGLTLSVSYEVLPEIKEYERTSTTVINAYVMPIVASYLRALRSGSTARASRRACC